MAAPTTASRTDEPATIALLSPCGWGNLGDAAIVDSLIHGIRERTPNVRIVAFTLNPQDTSERHSVEAYTCAAFSLPLYPVREPSEREGPGANGAGSVPKKGLAGRIKAAARSALRRWPIHGAARTWALVPFRVMSEPSHYARSRKRLEGASTLIVAGGGQLDGAWGGTLGHPYVLWRWGRLARSVGARFVFASVGTGSLTSLSRRLVQRALALASYRSYRDERSRELLRSPRLVANDAIVPDLAYALPVEAAASPRGDHLVIGLSPMNYRLPNRWPRPDAARYRAHIAGFAELGARAIADGHEVVMFATDDDAPAIDDVVAAIRRLSPGGAPKLRIAATPTVDALLATLAEIDVVVAARLHGVILSHVALRPVLAVAHERKVKTVMEEMGHQHFCLDIDFDPRIGYARLLELARQHGALTEQIAARVAANRRRVVAQYDALFGPAVPGAG